MKRLFSNATSLKPLTSLKIQISGAMEKPPKAACSLAKTSAKQPSDQARTSENDKIREKIQYMYQLLLTFDWLNQWSWTELV